MMPIKSKVLNLLASGWVPVAVIVIGVGSILFGLSSRCDKPDKPNDTEVITSGIVDIVESISNVEKGTRDK